MKKLRKTFMKRMGMDIVCASPLVFCRTTFIRWKKCDTMSLRHGIALFSLLFIGCVEKPYNRRYSKRYRNQIGEQSDLHKLYPSPSPL